MKLKKIASLALAGIMAISMLTACGESNTITEQPQQPQKPTVETSEIATALNNQLFKGQADMLSFTSDSKLASLLKRVATDDEDFEQMDTMISAAGRPTLLNPKDGFYGEAVAKIVAAAYNGTVPEVWMTNGNVNVMTNNNRTYLYVYTVDGSMTSVDQIAAAVMNGAGKNGLQDNIYDVIGAKSNSDKTGGIENEPFSVNYEYKGYAEMVKVTNDNSSDTAYVVAVMVQQHAVTND